jgi:predicted nucleic acid-binding protein
MTPVYADTSYFLALLNRADPDHARAAAYSTRPARRLVTSELLLIELGGSLNRQGSRALFAPTIERRRTPGAATIVPASHDLFQAGLDLYLDRTDKEWSMVDCTSFVIMWKEGIREALSTDRHFQQAGFRALLIEP